MRRFSRWFVLAVAGCGTFLGGSDDDPPSATPGPDAATGNDAGADDARTGQGEGGGGDAGIDASKIGTPRRVTCGKGQCPVGATCCIGQSRSTCITGEQPCFGTEYTCTRRLDCAPGELCCISRQAGANSTACVAAATCPELTDMMCNTGDDAGDTGCITSKCSSSGRAVSVYELPSGNGEAYGVCQ